MKEQHNEIHIALAFDENFIIPFYVLLTSIFKNNKENNISFHVIATGVNEKEKNRVTEYVGSNNANIHFYDIHKFHQIDALNTSNLKSSTLTIAAYYRLFFPFLVSSTVKKLLYIDVDTVVLNNLENLYFTDISPFPVGAVKDNTGGLANSPLLLEKIGVKINELFNSGVLLIDIEKWKQENIFETAMQFVSNNKEILKYHDQDALNYALKHNWFELSNLNNFSHSAISIDHTKKEILKNNKIIILHYTASKPWHFTNGARLRSFYYYYLNKTPAYVNKKKYFDFDWTYRSFHGYIYMRAVEFYFDHPIVKRMWRSIKSIKSAIRIFSVVFGLAYWFIF